MINIPAQLTGPSGFRNFLWLSWKAIGLPEPTPVQYDIADFMQHGGDRIVVMAFRGVGKSYIASAFVVWNLLLNNDALHQVVSGSKIRADDFTTFTLRLMHELGDLTEHLLPREDQRNSKVAFDVGPAPPSHSPSVTSKGIFSQLTGGRADIIIPDDVSTKQNSATQLMRDKISNAFEEFHAILKPNGRIIVLGTPQSEQDLLHELPNRGFTTRIWPAEVPPPKVVAAQGDRLAPMIRAMVDAGVPVGTPTDPLRFDTEDLEKRRIGYGRTGYALQFLLDQSLADAERYPLRINDLIVEDLDDTVCYEKYVWANDPSLRWNDPPCAGFNGDFFHRPLQRLGAMVPYGGVVMSVDPSGRGTDETGYAVVGQVGGQLFVLDCGGIRGGFDQPVLERLAATAARFKVGRIVVEENFGGGMFEALLKPVLMRVYPCPVETIHHSVQKEHRICDTLEPLMNAHRVIFNRAIFHQDWQSVRDFAPEDQQGYLLQHQMSRLTREKGALRHDDRVDALAMACAYWVKAASLTPEATMAVNQEERSRRALERFLEHAIGAPVPQHPTFFQARPTDRAATTKRWS